MASARITLDPESVEAIARRVVQLLQEKRADPELVDAAELARRLGFDRSWVYTHAIELGGVRLGAGTRPRLRFDPNVAMERIHKPLAGERPRRPESLRPIRSIDRPSLLPIKGGGES